MRQSKGYTTEQLRQKAKEEIGGVYAYLDLIADQLDLDIETCIRDTFNDVSEREGFEERI